MWEIVSVDAGGALAGLPQHQTLNESSAIRDSIPTFTVQDNS